MPINEIEIKGTSFGVQVFKIESANMKLAFEEIYANENLFNAGEERQGFCDLDSSGEIYAGSFGQVVAFEIECLEDGFMVEKTLKKIALVNFWIVQDLLFVQGPASVAKALNAQLMGIIGFMPTPLDVTTRELQAFSERMARVSSVSFQNPKEEAIRKGKISGSVEGYEAFEGISKEHMVDSISGKWDSGLGQIGVTVTGKGKITLGVKKGFILTIDTLLHLVLLITDSAPNSNGHLARANAIGKNLNNFLKKEGVSMSMTVGNETVNIGKVLTPENAAEEIEKGFQK